MNGRPPNDKPPIGRLLPPLERRPSIPGMEVIGAGFMQNSAKFSPVAALDEPTRCSLMPKLPVPSNAFPQRANTAVHCRKLPPLPCTLTFLSPECPVKFAKEGIGMVATPNNSSIAGAFVGRAKRMTPLKTIKKKDDLLVKGSRMAIQQSTELIKTDKKAKIWTKNILSLPASIASNQDVCTQKPQPPSKPGQRLRSKKTAEAAATALHDLNVEVITDVSFKTPSANIAADFDPVEQGFNTTATNGCGTVTDDISDEAAAISRCGDPLAHQETAVAPQRVLETPQEMAAMGPRATSNSRLEEIRARRKARKQTEKAARLQPGSSRSKVPVGRVSRSPELFLISEVDECSPSSSQASSPGKSEQSHLAVIQPHPPAGPRPPRRSSNSVRQRRSQERGLEFIAYEEETEEDEQDRQMLEAMLLPWFQSKGRAP